jgi:cobalt-precorrin 5A hydrolase/precorrin-3B C17-methyltransferase
MTPVVLALSPKAVGLGERVAQAVGGRLRRRGEDFADTLAEMRGLFAAGVPVVGICASGILVRAVAPLLSDKRAEPPLVAVAEDGSAVVPLLGGHHGANDLARRIAAALGGAAAVTTAGDLALGVALDAPPPGWVLANPEAAKAAMAALVAGGGARVGGEERAEWLDTVPRGDAVEIVCSMRPVASEGLVYRPQRAALGVGCSRGCPPGELIGLVEGVLAEAGVAVEAVKGVYTLDLKGDEPAMAALAAHLRLPLRLFDAAALEAEAPRLVTPSEVVFAEVGCHGVSEGAALAGAGPEAVLRVAKRKTAMATAALAVAPEPIVALRGRGRGRLAVVGIGPGQADWRTPEASRLVAAADEVVGYSLYLDLLGPLIAGKTRTDYPLGEETERCRYALEAAGQGRDVALVSSGDAGIYAMAALVWELIGEGKVSAAARAVEVTVAPGISALQAAAARIGAPLGHDFCAISLSDLLTPREAILRRVKAAAEGDFVVAFYNPVSMRRRTLLAEAREMLLAARPGATPVVLAANLGRPDERVRVRRLDALEVNEVDMLTLVLVGSSASRVVETPDGARVYTPRGYAAKGAPG